MKHEFYKDERGILQFVYHGELNNKENLELVAQIIKAVDEEELKGNKIKAVFDLSEFDYKENGIDKFNALVARDLNFEKTAVFGVSEKSRKYVQFIIENSGKSEHMKICDTRNEAEEWVSND